MMGLLDIAAAAAALNTTPRHVRGLIHERGLPYVKVGQLVRIDERDLEAWLSANRRVKQ
jgi:excisionase family DNA binding protein